MQAAIADGHGTMIPGFERENCKTFTADSVAHQMKWRGRTELPAATFVKLHFFLRKASCLVSSSLTSRQRTGSAK